MSRIVFILFFVFLSSPDYSQSFYLSDSSFQVNDIIAKKHIHFQFNRSKIDSFSFPFLDSIVTFLNSNDSLTIEIKYIDQLTERKKRLSRRLNYARAKEIRDYLIQKGIHTKRLFPKGSSIETEEYFLHYTEFKILAID